MGFSVGGALAVYAAEEVRGVSRGGGYSTLTLCYLLKGCLVASIQT